MSKNTLQSYRRDLHSFQEFLSLRDRSISSAETADVEAFISSLKDGELKPSSIARTVVAIRSLYKFLARENGTVDIAREVKPPRIPKRLP
ncbi:MAG: site-specific tyrosine recombinase XerD, partial [Actinobacteria bacterium]|nr:site-specific tyrosine recombinase XerD [Actinomycetota bacterium]